MKVANGSSGIQTFANMRQHNIVYYQLVDKQEKKNRCVRFPFMVDF